jgi:hypothetical protein
MMPPFLARPLSGGQVETAEVSPALGSPIVRADEGCLAPLFLQGRPAV